MYPIEKYKFYTNGSRVIAVSTYAGKTVRGVAVCHAGDTFSLEKGKKLAALRCAEKIAKSALLVPIKRLTRLIGHTSMRRLISIRWSIIRTMPSMS